MIKLLQQDSLATTVLPILQAKSEVNLWLWVAIIEAAIIVALLLVIAYKKSTFHKLKAEILSEQPDFNNLFDSVFNAERLYKELSRICHPDRFAPDKQKMEIANELFQRVAKNRNNIKMLQELKNEITQKLL